MNACGPNRIPHRSPAWGTGWCVCCLLVGFASHGIAADTSFQVQQETLNFFPDRENIVSIDVSNPEGWRGQLQWTLSAESATLGHGKKNLDLSTGDNEISVSVRTPGLREGVSVKGTLTFNLRPNLQGPVVEMRSPFWMLGEKPFAGRSRALQSAKIDLFDPSGETEKAMTGLGLPFTIIRRPGDIDSKNEGLLIVGEATKWSEYRGLPERITDAVKRGVSIIALAPSGGQLEFPIPDADGEGGWRMIRFEMEEFGEILDDRLPLRDRVHSRVLLGTVRNRVVGTMGPDSPGYSWIEMRFGKARVPLIICGYSILEDWDTSPTGRYLLDTLLRYTMNPK